MPQVTLAEAVSLAHALVDQVARDNDVRVLFIKGPAAVAQGLREPRTSLDVDVLVDPAGLATLRERLSTLGWVDEHPYSTPTSATYSRTHRHPSWPCELDLHTTFPGLYADQQEIFERLWARRVTVEVAGRQITCPDPGGHALVLALNSLRDLHETSRKSALSQLVDRVSSTYDADALRDLGDLAGRLGAADTAAPFLSAVGAPNESAGSTSSTDLRAWRLRTQPGWRVATWIHDLRRQPLHAVPGYLWRAAILDESELRIADPGLPPGRLALARARMRRLRRGLSSLPQAIRAVRGHHGSPDEPPVAR